MTVTVLLPVSKFNVPYQIGSGKPFSELHRLVLQAVGEGSDTLASLESFFFVPQRLLLEILTTLFEEGWLSMTHAGRMRLTALGRAGCSGEKAPSSHRVSERNDVIVLERHSGCLANQQEVYWQTRSALRRRNVWDAAIKLRADYLDDRLNEGQVRPLLRRKPDEWIRHIAEPDLKSKDWHWVELQVDLETRHVIGLPSRWEGPLKEAIVSHILSLPAVELERAAAAGALPSRKNVEDDSDLGIMPEGTEICLDPSSDIVVGSQGHRRQLLEILREADRSILLCTPRLGKIDDEIASEIASAARRGVTIDVAWGAADPGALTTLQQLADGIPHDWAGQIRYNEDSLRARVSALIWSKDQAWRAVLGGFPWTGDPHNDGFCFSVQVGHPQVISEVCLTIAGIIYEGKRRRLSGAANRWREVSATLERAALDYEVSAPNCSLLLVHNHDHGARMLEFQRTSQVSFLAAGISLGLGIGERLRGFSLRGAAPVFSVELFAQHFSGDALPELKRVHHIREYSCAARPLFCEFVIADGSVLFGPHSWLSGPASAGDQGPVYELGYQIDHGPLAEILRGRICGEGASA